MLCAAVLGIAFGHSRGPRLVRIGETVKYLATIKSVSGTEHEEYFFAGLLHELSKIPLKR
jgi:hypothetical protein